MDDRDDSLRETSNAADADARPNVQTITPKMVETGSRQGPAARRIPTAQGSYTNGDEKNKRERTEMKRPEYLMLAKHRRRNRACDTA
ncbi:hypothetical protein AB1N83_013894 [Pleurotus pulmonarius]